MKDKINKICTELNDGKIAVVQATEQLFDLYSVSQQRELLPEFLMKDGDGKIVTAYIGGADVTEEWNKYLGNCG
jgi:hypothetical protein